MQTYTAYAENSILYNKVCWLLLHIIPAASLVPILLYYNTLHFLLLFKNQCVSVYRRLTPFLLPYVHRSLDPVTAILETL